MLIHLENLLSVETYKTCWPTTYLAKTSKMAKPLQRWGNYTLSCICDDKERFLLDHGWKWDLNISSVIGNLAMNHTI